MGLVQLGEQRWLTGVGVRLAWAIAGFSVRTVLLGSLIAAVAVVAGVSFYPDVAARWLPHSVVSLFGGNAGEAEEASSGTPTRARRVGVVVSKPKLATAQDVFTTTGEITAADSVVVSSEVPGRIAEVLVRDGDRVRAGDPLIRFDDSEQKAALDSARAALAEAENNLERRQELEREDFASDAELEQARTAAQAASARVEQAQERLKDQIVRAPFDGEVGFVHVSEGAFVEPGNAIASLATTRKLRATFNIPLKLAKDVEVGDRVYVRPPGLETRYETTLMTLSPIAEAAARSIRAEAEVDKNETLRPGAFVEIELVTARRENSLFISEAAVLRRGQQALIYRVGADEEAIETVVKLGARREGMIEIRSDAIEASDFIVVDGLQKISDGTRLDTRPSDRAGEANRDQKRRDSDISGKPKTDAARGRDAVEG